MKTTDVLTRSAHCGGCGGPREGRSHFELALSSRRPGMPLPVWVCVNCGRQHNMRGNWSSLTRRLVAAGATEMVALVEAR